MTGRRLLAAATFVVLGVGLLVRTVIPDLAVANAQLWQLREPVMNGRAAIARGQALAGLGALDEARIEGARAVYHSPLAQSAMVIVYLAAGGGVGARPSAAETQLAKLGLRDATAQRLLAEAAYARGDARAALARYDAMARSTDNRNATLEILSELEGEARMRPALVERLHLKPYWRTPFLQTYFPRHREALLSRFDTLVRLSRTSSPPVLDEVAEASRSSLDQNLGGKAYAMLRMVLRRPAGRAMLDADFALAWKTRASTSELSNPFIWSFSESARGLVGPGGSAPETGLTFNGRPEGFGPVASVVVPASLVGPAIVLTSDNAGRNAPSPLEFELSCPDARRWFYRQTEGSVFSVDRPTADMCEFPRLDMKWRAGASDNDYALSRIDFAA